MKIETQQTSASQTPVIAKRSGQQAVDRPNDRSPANDNPQISVEARRLQGGEGEQTIEALGDSEQAKRLSADSARLIRNNPAQALQAQSLITGAAVKNLLG